MRLKWKTSLIKNFNWTNFNTVNCEQIHAQADCPMENAEFAFML